MNFSCEKKLLFDNINVVMKAVSTKSTVPILEGIYIKAENNKVKLFANDLKIAIEANIECEVEEAGEIVLNAKLFFEIISKLPEGIVNISTDGDLKTNIKCLASKFEIFGMNPEDFPSVEYNESDEKIKISKTILKNIIRQTIFSIGTDEKKIVLTGALFAVNNKELKVVTLDGFRLSYRKTELSSDTLMTASYIIPGKTLSDLLKILNDEESEVNICFTGNRVNINFDNCILYSNLIDGEFFNYEHILPNRCELNCICDTKSIIDSIIRSSLIITPDVKSPLKFDISKDQIYMTSMSKNGKAEDTLMCKTDGGDLSIGFNHKYLLDALRACDTKEVKLEFTSSLNPLVIKGADDDSFIYLVLPLRLRNE